MKLWGIGQISSSEKDDILSKHKELYNGYKTLYPDTPNTQPMYTYDFAGDKGGLVVNNKGEVKPYTNFGINESKQVCSECGTPLMEGECMECGWKGDMQELSPMDLMKGDKYKYSSPSFEDEIEFDTEVEDKSGGKPMFKFKGEKAHHLMGDTDVETFISSLDEETECKECGGPVMEGQCMECGWKQADLDPKGRFDYTDWGSNREGSFEQMHHMKESATSNAPLSYGRHYDEVREPYNFKSNGPVGDGGTLRQKNIKEAGHTNDEDMKFAKVGESYDELDEVGYTGGGNAPVFEPEFDAYDFESDGPVEDTFTIDAPDMDLDPKEVKKPYKFISQGAEIGDAYPVNEDDTEWEMMESAWADELDEVDVSGSQGVYGDTKKPYAFVSDGPGGAGPYQTHSWGGQELSEEDPQGYEGEDEDAYWELEQGELNPDKIDRDATWQEITDLTGEDEFAHVDEELQESFQNQRNKINEMFLRMKVIK
jgi:hypothetical protein